MPFFIMYNEPKLLAYKEVRVSTSKVFILNCYYKKKILTSKEKSKIARKFKEFEDSILKINQAISIVEKIRDKFDIRT